MRELRVENLLLNFPAVLVTTGSYLRVTRLDLQLRVLPKLA